MKSLGVVALALLCIGLFAFAVRNVLTTSREWSEWEGDTTRYFTAVEVERLIQDSTDKILARLDSAAKNDSLVAERNKRHLNTLRGTIRSLDSALSRSQTPSDSLVIALQTNEVLDSALGVASHQIDALERRIGSQSQMLGIIKLENERVWRLLDSASSVIRRVPKSCRVPLLGLPCPVPTVGLGMTADGIRAYVGVGFLLRQH